MPGKNLLRIYHLFFGLLNTVALTVAFFYALNSHSLSIYFSYFTILSNIFVTILFLYFGLEKKEIPPKSKFLTNLYAASVLYMMITGIVFWTILRNNHTLSPTQWTNFTLHGIMPLATFIGWIIFSPRRRLKPKDCIQWLIFPVIFVIYTLVRGPIAHWYPYPFLDPTKVGGYGGVFTYITIILLGSLIASQILIFISNLRTSKGK